MKTVETRGRSRRQQPKSQRRKEKRVSHLQTVRRGGFEESQVICRFWDIVKVLETGRKELDRSPGTRFADRTEKLEELEKQLRRQIRVEVRRYFVRRRHRNARMIGGTALAALCVVCLFTTMIGIDRVSGESMYPYLNHGDWIVFSRISPQYRREDVVVFEKNGENLVKRIAGLPGDRVQISTDGSQVVVNDEQIPAGESAVGEKTDVIGESWTVMDRQYLVLGDNRSISIDSRDKRMGTVSREEILGRVILVVRMN